MEVIEDFLERGGDSSRAPLILLDFGYGLPKEPRPRREKLLAIAKQVTNFLLWQIRTKGELSTAIALSNVVVAGAPDDATGNELRDRIQVLWKQEQGEGVELPDQLCISSVHINDFHKNNPRYLSPDAETVLDVDLPPPKCIVIGLLIDRRIQKNRSLHRASNLNMECARLPLEQVVNLSANEPLNVDCILELYEAWHRYSLDTAITARESFSRATFEAVERHTIRHTGRPRHLHE